MRVRPTTGRRGVALFVAVATAMATLAAVQVIQPAAAVPEGAGRLDASFDVDGLVAIDAVPALVETVFGVVLDAARRPVVVSSPPGGGTETQVTRLTTEGKPDLTFGDNGTYTISWSASGSVVPRDIAIDSAGKIIVLAVNPVTPGVVNALLVRLTPTGGLDSSFAAGGFGGANFGTGENHGFSIATDSLNRILVGGYRVEAGVPQATVVRVNADGTDDNTFGIAEPSEFSPSDVTEYVDVAVDASDRVYVTGYANGDTVVSRFQSDGVYDAAYPASSANGVLVSGAYGNGIAVAPDGSGVAVSAGGGPPGTLGKVIRLDDDGTLYSEFGTAGVMSFTDRSTQAVAMPNPDNVIVTGYDTAGSDMYVARLDQVGDLDTSFGDPLTPGVRTVPFEGIHADVETDVALDSAGGAVVSYGDQLDGRTQLARFTGDIVAAGAATKIIFTDMAAGVHQVFGMSPDGSGLVGLTPSGDDGDHGDPMVNEFGAMVYEFGNSLWLASGADGSGVTEAGAALDFVTEPSIGYDDIAVLDGDCAVRLEIGGSYAAGNGPCGLTSLSMRPDGQSILWVKNGDLYVGPWSTDESAATKLTNFGTVVDAKWGFDGTAILYETATPASHRLRFAQMPPTFNASDELVDRVVFDSGDAAISGFALTPDGADPSFLVSLDADLVKYNLDTGVIQDIVYRGNAPIVSSWNRNLGVFTDRIRLEPDNIRAEDVPLQSSSPAAKEADPNIQAAGLSKLAMIKSPLSKLALIKSPLSKLALIKSGLSKLALIKSPLTDEGLDQISLAQMVIVSGPTWRDRLLAVNTSEAAELSQLPLQQVSLGDVLDLSPIPELPSLEQLDLSQGLFGTISVMPFLLGATPLRAMNKTDGVDGIDWCGVFNARQFDDCGKAFGGPGDDDGLGASLLGLQIAGFDLDNLVAPNDLRTLTYDDVDFDDEALLPNLVVAALDLHELSIGSALVRNITPDPNAVIDCTAAGADCGPNSTMTLAQAKQAGLFRLDSEGDGVAVLSQLGDALDGFRLNELALGAWGVPGDDPYDAPPESLGINAQTSGANGQYFSVGYARVATGPGVTTNPAVKVVLPPGLSYSPGSSYYDVNFGGTTGLADPMINGSLLTWDVPVTIADQEFLRVNFRVIATGAVLEPLQATVTDGFIAQSVGSDPIEAYDNSERGDTPAGARHLNRDTLYFARLEGPTDLDYFRLDAPDPGSTLTVYVSQLRYNADLAVYHPTRLGPGDPLRPPGDQPVLSSTDDTKAKVVNSGEPLETDGEADIPLVPGLAVAGLSNNIGTKAERVEVITWPSINTGEGNDPYLAQVSGFNGAFGTDTYAIRYTIDEPGQNFGAANSQFTTGGPFPSLPPLPATDPSSLILTNTMRQRDLYPGGAAQVASSLSTLAAATNGLVFPVDAVPEVRAAYANLDLTPGDPDRANDVVRAINTAVDNYLGPRRASLESIVIGGPDPILPMARIADLTQTANEKSFSQELIETAAATGGNNMLLGAARQGRILTDDPYGSFTPRDFAGSWLYVPDVAIGRLVETPEQIAAAVNEFMTTTGGDGPGVLRPDKTLAAGYDFMSRMATAIDESFAAQLPTASRAQLLDDEWNKSAARDAVVGGGDAPDLIALNAHYSPQALAPAKRFDSTSPDDPDLTAADLTASADLRRRLLFTMGCHSGFNIANYLAGGQPADWPEATAGEPVSAFVGNTGYGLGLRHVDAFSQKLFRDFATGIGQYNLGTALMRAKQAYLADGVTNPYDYKVLAQATYFGIPGYIIAGAQPPPDLPPNPAASVDPDTDILTASVDFSQSTDTSGPWRRVETADGDYWRILGGGHAVTQHRPIQPQLQRDVTQPDQVAVGALITGIELGDDESGFDPVLARPVIDSTEREPEVQFGEMLYPANLVSVTNFNAADGARQRVSIVPAQFTSSGLDDEGMLVGNERRFSTVAVDVLYRPTDVVDPDLSPPTLSGAEALQGPNATQFNVRVRDPESDIVKVIVLYRVVGDDAWQSLKLIGDGEDFSGAVGVNDDLEFLVQAVNSQGLVGGISNRGRQFNETTVPDDPDDTVTVTFDRTKVNGYFDAPVTVHLESSNNSQIFISKDAEPETTFPGNDVLFDTDGNHSLTYRTAATPATPIAVPVDLFAPAVTIASPAAGTPRHILNENVAASYDCEDTSLVSCTGDAPDGTPINTATITTGTSTRSFSATGVDALGRATTVSHDFKVGYAPAGFPCDNGAGHQVIYPLKANEPNPTNPGQIMPVVFRVCDAEGVSQGPPVLPFVGAPREVNATTGELGPPVQGGCNPILILPPICLPILGKRQTSFSFSGGGVWTFRHDTAGLLPGEHRFRISLNDGTSLDYVLSVPR